MEIKFEIEDSAVRNVNQNGRTELSRCLKTLAEEIVDEATRVEASRNLSTNNEVTAAIISEAALYAKRMPAKKKKPIIFKIAQFVSTILSIYTGTLLDTDKLKNGTTNVWVFVCVLVMSISLTAYIVFGDE